MSDARCEKCGYVLSTHDGNGTCPSHVVSAATTRLLPSERLRLDVEERLILDVAQAIQELMRQQGISQRVLAERLGHGVNQSVVSRWVNGRHNMSLRTVAKILDALGCEAQITIIRK